MIRTLATGLAMTLSLVTASAQAQVEEPDAVLTPKQYGELAEALKGREPGKPKRCISTNGRPQLRAISNEVLIYRDGARVYATRVQGKCSGLTSGGALVTRPTGGQICRGDTAQVENFSPGGILGICAMGDFIPYTRPRKK